jgi:hypothetical protein
MNQRKVALLDHVISGLMKLNPKTTERQNVIAFFQSCYGGRVRAYDFDAALQSTAKLTEEEHGALAAYVVSAC